MPNIIPRDSAFGDNPQPNVWDQQVPFDFASGFSGQWVFGPFRIDQSTGNLTNDTGIGTITGFVGGFSGFSGFSGAGFSGPSGPSGFSGFSGFSGYTGFSGYSSPSGFSGFSGVSAFSGYTGFSGFSGQSAFSGPSGFSGFSGFSGVSYGFQMGLGGRLPTSGLPLTNLGIEISPVTAVLSNFRARRSTAGTAGTTTIQLEVNGSPVTGATLSWTNADAAYALKTTTFAGTLVNPGDRVSFRLTSSETNAQDIHAEAN